MSIDRSFPKHPLPKPSPGVLTAAAAVRDQFRHLAEIISELLPASREKSLALTHLEDSSTYAVKAVYADKVEVEAVCEDCGAAPEC